MVSAADKPSLSIELDDFTSYFTTQDILRHNRYEIHAKETVPLSRTLSTVMDLRGRVETAESGINASFLPHYSSAVTHNELFEGEIRQLYMDWLGDKVRMKTGIMQIDWIESLSPLTSDIMTPLDLRFGGFGTNKEIIVPEAAVYLNHKLFGGTLEYLFVPLPVTHRLPVGDNGYGLYPYLANQVAPLSAMISTSSIPQTLAEVEAGVRYHLDFDSGLELSFLAYRGHQRTPTFVAGPPSASTIPITEVYGRTVTLGAFATYGTEAAIFRLFTYLEPHRYPASVTVAPGGDPTQLPYENRIRVGSGFDYVFSKHLKLYSEFTGTHTEYPNGQMNYLATVRLTNETFKDFMISLNATIGFPYFSSLLTPEVAWNFQQDMSLGLGAHLIQSSNVNSAFEMLKNASQVYATYQYTFALW